VAGAMALVTLGCIGMEEDRQKIVDFVMDMGENGVDLSKMLQIQEGVH
jgi:hypothetical protein